MPWEASDATRHTKKADTPKEQSLWARIANRMLESGHSDGSAIRVANSVIKKGHKKRKRRRKR